MRKNLKDARKRLGMTQSEMADQLGISIRTYQSIEQGRRGLNKPSLTNINRR